MSKDAVFADTDPELLPILEELRRCEPIFHSAEFGRSVPDYQQRMADGYWEVGASGRRYNREFILRWMEEKPPQLAGNLGWKCWDHALRRLGPDTYLMTYVLQQGERLTRRATIWTSTPDGWQILYHQGTIVSAEEDNIAPA